MHRLSFTGREWRHRDGSPMDDATAALHARDAITLLLRERAIDDALQAPMVSPGLLPDGERAADRLRRATENNEHIGIFGDYDCDGVTSAAQLLRWARRHGNEPIVRLPHRVHDGYGIKPRHVDTFADAGVTLLVTADTGITAVDAASRAKERGIDLIVIDHHSPGDELPDAFALVHPSLARGFPLPHPSAAGVVFAFLHLLELGAWAGYDEDLALAAIGTVADLVPLAGPNRSLVRAGLAALNALRDGPLAQLVAAQRSGNALTATDIAFRIAPRINAAGRMDDPMLALHALLEEGTALGALEAQNIERQELTAERTTHAWQQAIGQNDLSCLCVTDATYPHGIIGLLAGKLTERSGKPALAGCIDGDLCTLSARSPAVYNIIEGLRRCAPALAERGTPFVSLGGHAQAAGCTLPAAAVAALHALLCGDVAAHVDPSSLRPFTAIDAVLDATTIDLSFCAALDALAPYGQGNPEPRFLLRDVTLAGGRAVGADGKHLQVHAAGIKAIGFGLGSFCAALPARADVLCRVGIDTWQNRRAPQLFLEDFRTVAVAAVR